MATFAEIARREAQELKLRQSELASRRLDDLHNAPSDTTDLFDVGARFDAAYASLGAGGTPAPLPRESAFSYRRRLAAGLQRMSPAWRDVDLFRADVMDAAEAEILADVKKTIADRTRGDGRGGLREIRTKNAAGATVIEWAGHPSAWLSRFAGPAKAVKRFQTPDGTPIRVPRRSI
jgi:hypothetical protein